MLASLLRGEMTLPFLPTTVALAAVATLGYLVGRRTREADTLSEQSCRDLRQTLDDTRQLEQITDDMLQATRQALDECRRLSFASRTDIASAAASGRPSHGLNGISAFENK